MSVVPLCAEVPANNIAETLRVIADEVERGDFGLVTTAVLCFGHTGTRPEGDDQVSEWTTEMFGMGPRVDMFTVRGLLMSCAMKGQ